MTTTTPPKRSNYILFVGNPGVGKSTLLNGLLGEAKFLSGASYGSGLTQALQLCEHEGIWYGDTPGLEDSKMKQQAAREIKNALTQDGRYRIVFVCTTEGGRVRGQDLATISCVLKAIQKESIPYGIVYNKLENRPYRDLQQSSDEYVQLKLRCEAEGDGAGTLMKALQGVSDADVNSPTYQSASPFVRVLADVNSTPEYPTDHIFFYKRDGDLAGEDNVVPKLQDGFQQWLAALPAIDVKPEEVRDLAVDELIAVKAAHEAALVELRKTMAKVEELPIMQRRLEQMQASLDAMHRSHRASEDIHVPCPPSFPDWADFGPDASRSRPEPPSSPMESLMRDMMSMSVSQSCSNCGESGHNVRTCPSRSSPSNRTQRCGICGNTGHNRTTCTYKQRSPQRCGICGTTGHNRTTCTYGRSQARSKQSPQRCGECGGTGHNRRTCSAKRTYNCSVCGRPGHNATTCPSNRRRASPVRQTTPTRSYRSSGSSGGGSRQRCGNCGGVGHNRRTCGR